MWVVYFFFFKQKTAYEMRISDWSSDVCSSDLTMMDFSGSAGARTNFDRIPHGQLAFAIFSLRGIKQSQSGGQYLDVELTLDDGQPFARRKIFDMIMDPNFESNSDAAKQMGNAAIGRILEAGRNAGPHNPQGDRKSTRLNSSH